MFYLLYAYLVGFSAMVVLQHGFAQNPNCTSTTASKCLFAAIVWPIVVVTRLFSKD